MIIISGANGFVGQHLAPKALKYFNNNQILCLVANTMKDKALESRGLEILKKNGLKTLKVDLVTGKGLDKLPKSPKLVIHLAANADTSLADHRVNDIGTKNLLMALGPLNFKTHFLYTSTIALYSGRFDCSEPITESTPIFPTNEYGRSKLRAEEFLKEQAAALGFRLTIARFSTINGGDPREHKLFRKLKRYILKGSFLARLNWPGKTSIVYVEDVAVALLDLAKYSSKPGNSRTHIIYAESLSISEISHLMHEKMGIIYKPINLPKSFWKLCSFIRIFTPLLEKILPLSIYDLVWRAGLIVDNVLWCKSDVFFKFLPKWRPRRFRDVVSDEV